MANTQSALSETPRRGIPALTRVPTVYKAREVKMVLLVSYSRHISKTKILIWCEVPKAGSSSLARMFLRLADKREPETHARAHTMLRGYYPIPSPDMTKTVNTTFKFLMVRHPFQRVISAYRDKLEGYSPYPWPWLRENWRTIVKRPVPKRATVVYPTFQEFVTYLLETNLETYSRHWMPISRLCSPCSIHYDAIVKMENFSLEIKLPLQQVGIYEDVIWDNNNEKNRTTFENYFQQLSFTQIQKLYYIYREDFLLFDYTPKEYFALVAQNATTGNCTFTPTVKRSA